MKILFVNKFLYPNGGSETYVLNLGKYLESAGHEVQYFGMEHENRCVGNRVNAYTTNMNFHDGRRVSQIYYPIKTIYSVEARKKIRLVLDDFKPQVIHLNNFNYQLTPSILLEIEKWRKEGNRCRIIYTAHDYQLVCPNHMCHNPNTHENCEKCFGGHYISCIKGKCVHGKLAKSTVGALEAALWNRAGVYKYIDFVICCSGFMKTKLDSNSILAKKTVVMQNFVDRARGEEISKRDYVLYFGRYSAEKGMKTLLKVCKALPEIPFVFAGAGPFKEKIDQIPNIKDVGFLQGKELETCIREARFSVCPSEWYENCPLSVMESLLYGTPVLGADIGGIRELIEDGKTGELFESKNAGELKEKIRRMWDQREITRQYTQNCKDIKFDTVEQYAKKLMKIYTD